MDIDPQELRRLVVDSPVDIGEADDRPVIDRNQGLVALVREVGGPQVLVAGDQLVGHLGARASEAIVKLDIDLSVKAPKLKGVRLSRESEIPAHEVIFARPDRRPQDTSRSADLRQARAPAIR